MGKVSTKVLAIIPARGGSKRIPNKNIKDFCGKPIIEYSIGAAKTSGCFDQIMVSTDSTFIAELAVKNGADVPFFRSSATADDYSPIAEVIKEVLQEYTKQGISFEYICCLFPTAPFVTGKKLNDAYNEMLSSDANCLITVCQFSYPILRSFTIDGGSLQYNWPEFQNHRSQDLPTFYHDAGQFFFIRVKNFLDTGKIIAGRTLPFILPETEVQDIDTLLDWETAELKYKKIIGTNE